MCYQGCPHERPSGTCAFVNHFPCEYEEDLESNEETDELDEEYAD
jgi:hypothetical protein